MGRQKVEREAAGGIRSLLLFCPEHGADRAARLKLDDPVDHSAPSPRWSTPRLPADHAVVEMLALRF